jgi:DNA topoisomerase-1
VAQAARAKSAGRVQSVSLRLIVDREREIELFRAQEYWSVQALMEADGTEFTARLVRFRGEKLDRLSIGDGDTAAAAKCSSGSRALRRRLGRDQAAHPQPAAALHHLDASAGSGAQARLLGQPHDAGAPGALRRGSITYMRTDGVDMAPEAFRGAQARREPLRCRLRARTSRGTTDQGKNAQEAHEAIRPTDFRRDQAGLRATMPACTTSSGSARWRARWPRRGWSGPRRTDRRHRPDGASRDRPGRALPRLPALYEEGRDDEGDEEAAACRASRGDAPAKKKVIAEQHFTQPPPRYSEASLVKKMEELGIGRPSTYAAILQTLKDRAYVSREEPLLSRGERAGLLTAFLERFFERYVSYRFHRRAWRTSSTSVGGARGLAERCSKPSGATSSRRPPRSWSRSRPK